jgi:hypothetical protein
MREDQVKLNRILIAIMLIFILLPVQSCTGSDDEEKPAAFKSIPEIQSIKPRKPVKIKLKRNASGKYSWEISGDNADKVLEANKQLEKDLGMK